MDIWHFDRRTGELTNTGKADPSPFGEGEWLLPAWSTPVAPPEQQDGHALVWFGGSWMNVANHRGETWWQADAEFNDEPVLIEALGDPAEQGLTNVEPPARPVVVPPIVVNPDQIRRAMTALGWRVDFEGLVAHADQDLKDVWQFAPRFARDNAVIVAAAESLGRTPEETDALFELAKTL